MINIYRHLKPTLIIISIIYVVSISLQLIIWPNFSWKNISTSFFYNIYYGVPLCLVNGFFFDYLSDLVPWDAHPRRRAMLGVVGSIVITMVTLIGLNIMLWVYIWGNDFSILWNRENRSFYIIGLVITIIVSTTIHAIGFFQEVQKEKMISQKLRQEKLATELGALRSQVDPHFLFNSFNVLSGLIDEDTEKAQDFLAGLSKIYRYVLEQRNDDVSTVSDELSFAKKYLDLQQMRFENSIVVESQISDDVLIKKIPSLSLQLLLENAIKHNGFSDENPLNINIKDEGDVLIVTNSIQKRRNISDSAGMGLQNINDRYSLLTNKQITVDEDGELFTVKLPLI